MENWLVGIYHVQRTETGEGNTFKIHTCSMLVYCVYSTIRVCPYIRKVPNGAIFNLQSSRSFFPILFSIQIWSHSVKPYSFHFPFHSIFSHFFFFTPSFPLSSLYTLPLTLSIPHSPGVYQTKETLAHVVSCWLVLYSIIFYYIKTQRGTHHRIPSIKSTFFML